MSSDSDYEQPPEVITEPAEAIPIVDLEPPQALPPPPPSLPPPEDDCDSIPARTSKRGSLHNLIPVICGILILLLLMLCGFFGFQYFQSLQAPESAVKSLNQWTEAFQTQSKMFTEVQKVLNQNKETLEWIQKQTVCLQKTLQEPKTSQGDRCEPALPHSKQYFQTMEMVSWLNCSDLCISLNATFLKTERSELMNFLKFFAVNHTWLGLSYKEEENKWKWEDGSLPSRGLCLPNPSENYWGKCVRLKAHGIDIDNCTTPSSCMCEKNVVNTQKQKIN